MKSFLSFFVAFLIFTGISFGQTYTIGKTEYYSTQTYSTTGLPKVKRSASNKQEFLKSRGYSQTPAGYEIDHIIPLSQGGSDSPYNMQLLTVDQHKAKTARERSVSTTTLPGFNSSSSTYKPMKMPSYNSTYSLPKTPSYSVPSTGGKAIYTGSRGGRYYINSNGNKSYIKN